MVIRIDCHVGLLTSQTSGISAFEVIRGIPEESREISQTTCVLVFKLPGVLQKALSS